MLSERIKTLRKCLKCATQKDFSILVNFPFSRVQDIERGKVKELKSKEIEHLQEKFLVSSWWLLTGKGEMFLSKETNSQTITGNNNVSISGTSNNISNTNNTQETKEPSHSNLVEIPYLSDTYASAGAGALNYNDKPKPMAFDYEFLRSILGVTSFKNLHIINAVGNSMEPTITEGELLFVNPFENEYNQIKDGGIYVINCNNSVFVKRINHNPITGAVVLISDNERVADIEINGQEFESCIIIGRVVGHFASF